MKVIRNKLFYVMVACVISVSINAQDFAKKDMENFIAPLTALRKKALLYGEEFFLQLPFEEQKVHFMKDMDLQGAFSEALAKIMTMNSSDKVSIASAIIKTLPMPLAQLLVSSYYAKDNLFFRIDKMQLPLVDELRRGTYMDFLGKLQRKDVQEIHDVHLINFSPNGEYLAIAHNDTVLTFYKKESQREAFEKRGSVQFQNRIELFELEVNMEGPVVVVYEKGPSEGMYTKTLLSLRTSDKLFDPMLIPSEGIAYTNDIAKGATVNNKNYFVQTNPNNKKQLFITRLKGERHTSLVSLATPIESYDFSPDETYLATVGANPNAIRVISLSTGLYTTTPVAPEYDNNKKLETIKFSPEGKAIFAGGKGFPLMIFSFPIRSEFEKGLRDLLSEIMQRYLKEAVKAEIEEVVEAEVIE